MIEVKNISKSYNTKNGEVKALSEIDLKIKPSEFVLVKGESGSGKTTLLFSLGGMQQPTSGEVIVNSKKLYSLSEKERIKYRANEIGFVFQSYHLLPYLNILENIMLPNKVSESVFQKEDVVELVKDLGIDDRLYHKPSELSAGEKQRVALARALITKPALILADEPTGNLDKENTLEVMKYFKKFQENGGTVVMVTHGDLADDFATRIIKFLALKPNRGTHLSTKPHKHEQQRLYQQVC